MSEFFAVDSDAVASSFSATFFLYLFFLFVRAIPCIIAMVVG